MVNGLPLALELAAVWVRHMTCQEIADEIERGLSFLATNQKNVPVRHRSLQAAFEHSWALLSSDERRAFARLAVFRDGGERDAMLSVAQCALPVLRALCDKSLLNHTPSGRYTVHELLRQFAEGKLRAMAHEFEDVQALHCTYYVEFVYAREDALNALLTARKIGSVSATLFGLVSAARLVSDQRQRERAAEIASFVFNHAAANHETKNRAGHLLDERQAQLPAVTLAAMTERGQTISLDDAVVSVLVWAAGRQ